MTDTPPPPPPRNDKRGPGRPRAEAVEQAGRPQHQRRGGHRQRAENSVQLDGVRGRAAKPLSQLSAAKRRPSLLSGPAGRRPARRKVGKTKLITLMAALTLSASASHTPRHTFYHTVEVFCDEMIDAADAATKASNLGLPQTVSESILSNAIVVLTSLLEPIDGMRERIEGVLLPYVDELAARAHSPIGHDWSSPQQTTMCAWVLDRCVANVASVLTPYIRLPDTASLSSFHLSSNRRGRGELD